MLEALFGLLCYISLCKYENVVFVLNQSSAVTSIVMKEQKPLALFAADGRSLQGLEDCYFGFTRLPCLLNKYRAFEF